MIVNITGVASESRIVNLRLFGDVILSSPIQPEGASTVPLKGL